MPIDLQIHPHALAGMLEYYDLANEAQLLDRFESDLYYLSTREISQNGSSLPIHQGPPLAMSETACHGSA